MGHLGAKFRLPEIQSPACDVLQLAPTRHLAQCTGSHSAITSESAPKCRFYRCIQGAMRWSIPMICGSEIVLDCSYRRTGEGWVGGNASAHHADLALRGVRG